MKRIFSGMQSTGQLHLGNYLGALRNWVKLQNEYECFFGVMDLHAITVPQEPARLSASTREVAAAFYASGIDPARCPVYPQSAVPEHTYLHWILANHTPLGWLNRMTQFKEKANKNRELEVLGLYAYPVLMAADILVYKATHVPVGEDQKQHLELARDIAGAFNRQYKVDIFPLPEPMIMGEATRVMSLRDGTKKMSKSDESDYSRINLTDNAETIALKIRKAKTDPLPFPAAVEELAARPDIDNLVTIYAALDERTKAEVVKEFSGQQLSGFKNKLSDLAVEKMSPITARMADFLKDPAEIDRMILRALEKPRALAEKTLKEVKDTVGLWSSP
jgi:tryptophanyl-tRNA synthetase